MTECLQASYDACPYPGTSMPLIQVENLYTVARMHGVQAVPPVRARVLEIGCAAAENLLSCAVSFPQASFVGVDLSPVQINQGQRWVTRMGLDNLRLYAADIVPWAHGEQGHFDYIIAHGFLSWVPESVSKQFFALCAKLLQTHGVAMVSYNVLPGCHAYQAVRSWTRYLHDHADPQEQVRLGRASWKHVLSALPDDSLYGASFAEEGRLFSEQDPALCYHDYLEPFNQPFYFHQVTNRAQQHGLSYLTDAYLPAAFPADCPAELQRDTQRSPRLLREQWNDFLHGRRFRLSVFVPEAAEAVLTGPDIRRFPTVRVSANLVAVRADNMPGQSEPARLTVQHPQHPQRRIQARDLMSRALLQALLTAPERVAAADLLQRVMAYVQQQGVRVVMSDVAARWSDLALALLARDMIFLHSMPVRHAVRVPVCPQTWPLAWHKAQQGMLEMEDIYHQKRSVTRQQCRLLAVCDGVHDHAQLQALFPAMSVANELATLCQMRLLLP